MILYIKRILLRCLVDKWNPSDVSEIDDRELRCQKWWGEPVYNSSTKAQDADKTKWLWFNADKPVQFLYSIFQSLCTVMYKSVGFMK